MKPRTRARQKAGDKRSAEPPPQEQTSPALMPLAFALRVMHDETQPMALRVSGAKLAAALLPERAGEQTPPAGKADVPADIEQWSDLELARRIAHILMLGERELDAKDAQEGRKPVEKGGWDDLMVRLIDTKR